MLVGAVLPSVIWIAVDKTVWPFDQAWYGQVSVDLFVIGATTPAEWPQAMLHSFAIKAPGISWLGQAFIPIGMAFGSIELGLGIEVVMTQLGSLLMLLYGLLALANGRWLASFSSCLLVAAAPLFIAMSHQYFVEPLQMLAVAWFIMLACRAGRSQLQVTAIQLVGATGLALLAKTSTPIYCFAPGLFTTAILITQLRTSANRWHFHLDARSFLAAAAALGLLLAALAWYVVNFQAVTEYTRSTSTGPIALDYGSAGSFSTKLLFWLNAARQSFLLPHMVIIVAGLAFVALCLRYLRGREVGKVDRLDVLALLAVLEVIAVFTTFSFQVNEEVRFLLPLLPHLAVLIAWILVRIDHKLVSQGVAVLFVAQLWVVYQRAFGLAPPSDLLTYWVLPVHLDTQDRSDVEAAVTDTCTMTDVGHYNVVGVELPWFNANSLSFFASKELLQRPGRCYYTTLGYAESDPEVAWRRVLDLKTHHYLTLNPRVGAIPSDVFNRVSVQTLERIETSGDFTPEPLADHPRILLFRSTIRP